MKVQKPQNYNFVLHIFIPVFSLFIGGLIYIVFRESDFIFFQWIRFVGLDSWLDSAKDFSNSLNIILPSWVVYSLPSGVWAFAYTFVIFILWHNNNSLVRYFWYCSIPILIFGFEFMQYFKIVPGTFSIGDILTSLGGLLLGIYLGLRSSKT